MIFASKTARASVITASLLLTSVPALADEHMRQGAPKGIRASFFACMDKARGDIVGMGACITPERKFQDTRLNDAYRKLMARLDGKAQADLKASERGWLEFNGKTMNVELAVGRDDKTVNIEAGVNELYRYAARADALEGLAGIASD
ncbi:DUF1311 domain-containing protein [Bacillus sp. NP157]|nr:DUF1311 domain-containing protein [Bacillus sp. NP157]